MKIDIDMDDILHKSSSFLLYLSERFWGIVCYTWDALDFHLEVNI